MNLVDPSLEEPQYEMRPNERAAFDSVLKPSDSYNDNGIYWADLPYPKRLKFVYRSDGREAARELRSIWRMFKADPLEPIRCYFRNTVLPGAGLGLEGYVLFSIGNLRPLFKKGFPECWDSEITCNPTWIAAVEYLEICGIILGQILVGILGDWIGRRWGLIQDATIMFVGLLMLTAAWGVTQNGWVICYAWSLFVYGIGVGGEYPMTATSGMENAVGSGNLSTKDDRLHRGRRVTSAFLMQGWGQFLNQVILIILLLVFHHGSGSSPYSTLSVQWTYRVSFAIPTVGTLWLIYFRTYKLKTAGKQLNLAKNKSRVTGYDTESLKLTFKHFGGRLFATAGAWFANDIFFYGNKLFQSEFISVISPESKSSILPAWEYNIINITVSLVGYYLASLLIDCKLYGRKAMQLVGFAMCFICFIVPAFKYSHYTTLSHITEFQTMYFLSSFFNQFGPNSVTFLVAAEVFPTPVRASAHGFSAAIGKLGALTAAVLYNYIDTPTKFYVVPWFGLVGMIVTCVFLPDTTGLDLREQERRWQFIREGREEDYRGVAVHPRHLSMWENWRRRIKMSRLGSQRWESDTETDYWQRVEEMRMTWEGRVEREDGREDEREDEIYGEDICAYFQRTSKGKTEGLFLKRGDKVEEKRESD